MARRQHAAIQSRGQHFPVDKTIGTPPRGEIGDASVDGAERSVFWYVDMAAINLSRHVKL